jgi:KDO2-lipid IV(A) lauroyltransferase
MADLSYAYRPSALSPERVYKLSPDGIAWTSGGRGGFLAYGDIKRVRVFKARFIGSSATYWNCEIEPRSGRTIRVGAGHRAGFNAVEDRTSTYIPFVKELEARIAAANPELRVEMGRHWLNNLELAGGHAVVWLLRGLRHLSLERSAAIAAWAMRKIGPRLRGHRVAREQVAIAFPEKSSAEIETILSGMWDNLGRISAEYAHLDRIWDFDLDHPDRGRIVADARAAAVCRRLKAERGPVMMFGAHLSNWEVSGLAGRILAPHALMIYKAPRIAPIADELHRLRKSSGAVLMAADPSTVNKIRQTLKGGEAVAMLVDDYDADGIEVSMFNRPFRINPLFARFVRMFDCPFHGFRTVRLPDSRFRLDITEAIEPSRDAAGRIDVAGTMQAVASTIEGWVRERPEQWLWLHRRWR